MAALDAGTCPESGVHFLAMEFLEGPSLQSYMDEEGKLAEPEAVAVCQAVCEALVCLDEAGLVHGDLHVANLITGAQGTKVIDVLYLDSLAQASTMRRDQRVHHDLRWLASLLTQLLDR